MSAHLKKLSAHPLFKTGYFTGGKWHEAKTTFDVLDPATGDVVAKVAKAGKAETEAATEKGARRQLRRPQPGPRRQDRVCESLPSPLARRASEEGALP